MKASKRKYNVVKKSGTILFANSERIIILGSDRLLYRVELSSNKQFLKLKLKDGDVVWIYCVPACGHVLTIMNSKDQDEPPDPDMTIDLE